MASFLLVAKHDDRIDPHRTYCMASTQGTNVTQLLLDWRSGKQEALDCLMPFVYDELRRLAAHYMHS